jgi:ABC-type dipeptide/oligopeptide/nickel transport system permease component
MHSGYWLRRLLWAIPTLFGVALIVFVLLRVVPGDPIAMLIPPGARTEDIANLRALYGLDKPIWQQFIAWLGAVAQGDFGNSISLRENVLSLVLSRLPATLELAFLAVTIALALGVSFAMASVYWRGRWPDSLADGFSGLALAIPDFLWGLIFILVFGVLLPVMPISGRIDPTLEFNPVTRFYLIESLLRGELGVFASLISHLVLPALALALPLAAMIARVLKNSLNEAMNQDYIMLARVKGFTRRRIIWREALRNALIPTIALTGVQFTFLIGGTVLIEYIYAYPGIGNMAIGAVTQRDLPLIQGLVLTFAVLFIAINFLIDASYHWLDPRVRQR